MKGVVIEFDFAAMNGAQLLFNTAKSYLKRLDDIPLDKTSEARYLAGSDCAEGLARLFAVVKTKKTPPKAARELTAAFAAALNDAVPAAVTAAAPQAVTAAFRNFVKTLTDRGLKVVIATRADLEVVRPAFGPLLNERVAFYQETTDAYGALRWDSWRRACRDGGLRHLASLAVTGSGFGVKAALIAGMGSMAVVHDHVAYQDFGGADAAVSELSGPTAKKALDILRV